MTRKTFKKKLMGKLPDLFDRNNAELYARVAIISLAACPQGKNPGYKALWRELEDIPDSPAGG